MNWTFSRTSTSWATDGKPTNRAETVGCIGGRLGTVESAGMADGLTTCAATDSRRTSRCRRRRIRHDNNTRKAWQNTGPLLVISRRHSKGQSISVGRDRTSSTSRGSGGPSAWQAQTGVSQECKGQRQGELKRKQMCEWLRNNTNTSR